MLETEAQQTDAVLLTLNETSYLDDPDVCADLLGRIDSMGELLEATATQADERGRLPGELVDALRAQRISEMRVPRSVGGFDASICAQILALENLARRNAAAAWCTMVSVNAVGCLSTFFPDEAVQEAWGGDRRPLGSMVAAPTGIATQVRGGFRVTGQWRFCSNYHNADWVLFAALREEARAEDEALLIAVPRKDTQARETWNVTGLRGTGSIDFTVSDLFVPAHRAIPNRRRLQLRGERRREMAATLLAVYEHTGWALGAGRKALEMLAATLGRPGAPSSDTLKRELGELRLQYEAARELTFRVFSQVDRMSARQAAQPSVEAKARAIASYVTMIAANCVNASAKRAGARALFQPNPYEMLVRDMRAAQSHILVSEGALAGYGDSLAQAEAVE